MNFPTRRILYGVILGLLVVSSLAVVLEIFAPKQPAPAVTGEALVGGPFTLIDPSGRLVSNGDFTGRYMLIYFGYTYCPDVCPLALQKMSMALDILTAEDIDLAPLQPIFISVDPARDSPAIMGEYVAAFHPDLIGLTGSAEAIAAVAKAYRVYYARAAGSESGEPGNTGGDDYMMDHSSVIYLMGPDSRYMDHFTTLATPRDIAARLRPLLD
jgi:protein SCO1/2